MSIKSQGTKTLFEDTNIFLSNGSEPVYATVLAHYLTHKKPVTVKLLAGRIRNITESKRGIYHCIYFLKLISPQKS